MLKAPHMSWKSTTIRILLGALWLVASAMPFGGSDVSMAVDGQRLGVVAVWKVKPANLILDN